MNKVVSHKEISKEDVDRIFWKGVYNKKDNLMEWQGTLGLHMIPSLVDDDLQLEDGATYRNYIDFEIDSTRGRFVCVRKSVDGFDVLLKNICNLFSRKVWDYEEQMESHPISEKLQAIKKLCIERRVKCSDEPNSIRIYPDSFSDATIEKADVYEYLFKMGLDTRHTSTYSDEGAMTLAFTDIIIKK
jgi:hypothetical protein